MRRVVLYPKFFPLALLCAGSQLSAQPVLTSSMSSFPVGLTDSIYGAPATIAPGSGGAGITWNFSTLSPTFQATLTIINPSTSPYFSTFPTSTLCDRFTIPGGSTMYIYERITSLKYETLANNYSGAGTGSDYTPNPETQEIFPMNFADSCIDTFLKVGGSGGTTNIYYDGYGTLITPFGTYNNVVRIKKYWGPGDYSYNWYTTSPLFGMAMIYDAQSNAYTILGAFHTTGLDDVNTTTSTQLYPNPFSTSATLKIEANKLGNARLIITDAVGRIIRQSPLVSSETLISRDGLNSGIYFYEIINDGTRIANGKLAIE